MTAGRWLEIVAGFFALAAAGFWLASASPWKPFPKMASYWGAIPEGDPFSRR
jgi:hypothetical protein